MSSFRHSMMFCPSGALIVGFVGGGKGALIGAGAGLAGSALYTYKLNKKKRYYRKVRHH